MTLREAAPNQVVWVRGVVKQATPNAVLVTLQGPAGSPIPYPLDPDQPCLLAQDAPGAPATGVGAPGTPPAAPPA